MGGHSQFWTLLLVLTVGAKVTLAQNCNAIDSSALKYFALEIVFSGKAFETWLDGSNCCTWTGVTCNSAGKVEALTVVAADVPAPPPTGEPYIIGSAIGDLNELKNLTMVNIAFNGALPTTIGGLTKLQVLNLDGCNIAGVIPDTICKLNSLSTLIMKGNFLRGNVPSCISSGLPLTKVDLTGNSGLSGNIPFKP